MRKILALPLTALLLGPSAQAALNTDAEKSVPFFLNKESLFASGQVSRSALDASLLKTETSSQFQVEWNGKKITLKSDQLLTDIHTALNVTTVAETPLYSLNNKFSPNIDTIKEKTELQIIETDPFWAKIFHPKTGKIGWIPLHQLRPKHDDVGVYVAIRSAKLLAEPKSTSAFAGQLPFLSRISPVSISDRYIKLVYNNRTVYAPIEDFVTKADFATWIYHPEKNWTMITHRQKNFVQTKSGEQLFLAEVMGYVTNNKKGIVIRTGASMFEPSFLNKVNILHAESSVWGQSRISGHGNVWWKKEDLLETTPTLQAPKNITSEDLLKREIYSVAFESKSSVRGVLSSNGVYRTLDGLHWTLIPLFAEQNLPVSIHPNGRWFVGSYVSMDQGRTFEPFIRWDKVAETIERTQGKTAKKLRLTKIESLPRSEVAIHIDTGSKILKLTTKTDEQFWRAF